VTTPPLRSERPRSDPRGRTILSRLIAHAAQERMNIQRATRAHIGRSVPSTPSPFIHCETQRTCMCSAVLRHDRRSHVPNRSLRSYRIYLSGGAMLSPGPVEILLQGLGLAALVAPRLRPAVPIRNGLIFEAAFETTAPGWSFSTTCTTTVSGCFCYPLPYGCRQRHQAGPHLAGLPDQPDPSTRARSHRSV